MKIRIQDNSIRFRMTLKEIETLKQSGRLERSTQILAPAGPAGEFRYGLSLDAEAPESLLHILPHAIELRLSAADFETLCDPEQEGVYIRREWTSPTGERQRFMVFAEKDRPGATCDKPEVWIYDAEPGKAPETRPVAKTAGKQQDFPQ